MFIYILASFFFLLFPLCSLFARKIFVLWNSQSVLEVGHSGISKFLMVFQMFCLSCDKTGQVRLKPRKALFCFEVLLLFPFQHIELVCILETKKYTFLIGYSRSRFLDWIPGLMIFKIAPQLSRRDENGVNIKERNKMPILKEEESA